MAVVEKQNYKDVRAVEIKNCFRMKQEKFGAFKAEKDKSESSHMVKLPKSLPVKFCF